jgi:hypothetical protein
LGRLGFFALGHGASLSAPTKVGEDKDCGLRRPPLPYFSTFFM